MSGVIVVPADHTGPASSAQGGIAAGLLAAELEGPAEVRLHAPPPLGTPLKVEATATGFEARLDDTVILSARAAPVDIQVPSADLETARRSGYPAAHSIAPHCIVCGDRHPRGLEVHPGPIEGSSVIGTEWTPPAWTATESGTVRDDLVWGVLDCPGSWSFLAGGGFPEGHFPALGSIVVELLAPIAVGEPVVVLGWPVGVDGRKYRAASALLALDGRTLAVSTQTCIALPLDWAS